MKVKEFELVNPQKVERALHGNSTPDGVKGGIAKTDGSYNDDALIAEYDHLGGAILRGNDKVKMGSFYDFGAKSPREKPNIVFIYRVSGTEVEVPDGEELPGIVKAVKVLEENKKEVKKRKKK